MVALLVGLSIMAVMMAAALPVWSHAAQREKEAELVWRGEQYRRAIMLFQRKFANAFPPTVDVLVEQKFLRKKYKDPITNDDFQIIPVGRAGPGQGGLPGASGPQGSSGAGGAANQPSYGGGGFGGAQGGAGPTGPTGLQMGSGPGAANLGIQGVTSKSKETSIRLYNGMDKYNQWAFIALASVTQAGMGGGGGFANPGQSAPPGSNPGGFKPMQPGSNPFGPGSPTMPPVPGGFGQPQPFGQPGTSPTQPGGNSIFKPVQPGPSQPSPSPFGVKPPPM